MNNKLFKFWFILVFFQKYHNFSVELVFQIDLVTIIYFFKAATNYSVYWFI